MIWKLPSSGDIDACKQDLDEKVQWVGFAVTETHFVTVTDSHCRLWEVGEEGGEGEEGEEGEKGGLECKVMKSVEIPGFYRSRGVFHPNGEHLLVTTKMDVLVFDMQLELLSTHTGSYWNKYLTNFRRFLIESCLALSLLILEQSNTEQSLPFKSESHNDYNIQINRHFSQFLKLIISFSVLKTDDGSTTDIKITPDGTKFLITECRNSGMEDSKAFVWSCEDPVSASEHLIKEYVQTALIFVCTVIPRYNAPRHNADLAITRFFTPKVFLPHLLRKGEFSAKLVNISL